MASAGYDLQGIGTLLIGVAAVGGAAANAVIQIIGQRKSLQDRTRIEQKIDVVHELSTEVKELSNGNSKLLNKAIAEKNFAAGVKVGGDAERQNPTGPKEN